VPEDETPLVGVLHPRGMAVSLPSQGLRRRGSTYFCVSTVAYQNPLRRRRVDARCAYVVVLDDIGTKVDGSCIPVQPSYKLETSPGNFQWGYLIDPCTDLDLYEGVLRALAERGHTDAACIARNHVYRLPGSINVKRGEPFAAVLREWHPERTWDVKELARAFGVKPQVRRAKAREPLPPEQMGEFGSAFKAVLRTFAVEGWLLSMGEEKIQVLCPWIKEHGDRPETGTVLFRPSPDNGWRGGFTCRHGHCAGRGLNEVKQELAMRALARLPKMTPRTLTLRKAGA
jgi:hypothetical protein